MLETFMILFEVAVSEAERKMNRSKGVAEGAI